jgi:hypothetical protein
VLAGRALRLISKGFQAKIACIALGPTLVVQVLAHTQRNRYSIFDGFLFITCEARQCPRVRPIQSGSVGRENREFRSGNRERSVGHYNTTLLRIARYVNVPAVIGDDALARAANRRVVIIVQYDAENTPD